MKQLPCILTSLLGAAVTCLYIPEVTYFRNVNEFSFDHMALFLGMVPWFFAVFSILTVIQLILGKLLPNTTIVVFGRNMSVSAAQTVLVAILLGLLLEGTLLSRKLPALMGKLGAFSSKKRIIISLVGWLLLLLSSSLLWRKFARYLPTLAAVVLVMFTAMLADAKRVSEKKAKIKIDNAAIFENLAFHPKDNVILILSDAVPTFAVEKALERNPDIREKLTGFTLFSNNLGPGCQTTWALPALILGRTFDGGSYEDFCSEIYTNKDSLPVRFHEQGFDVFMTSLVPRFAAMLTGKERITDQMANQKEYRQKVVLTAPLYIRLGFRFIPYCVKWFFELPLYNAGGGWGIDKDEPGKHLKISEPYTEIVPRLDTVSERPTMHLHHYQGAHLPFLMGGYGRALPKSMNRNEEGLISLTEYILRNFVAFLDELHKRGMYENATIVLFGDHGDHNLFRKYKDKLTSYNTPLLLVKPPKASGALNVVDTPSMTVSLPEITDRLFHGDSLEAVIADFPKERRFLNTDDLVVYKLNGDDIASTTVTKLAVHNVEQPTMLEPNKRYIFGRGEKDFGDPRAVASFQENIDPADRYGLRYRATQQLHEGKLGFLVASRKKQVSLTVLLLRWQTPVEIRIRDLNTGKILIDRMRWDTTKQSTYELTIPDLTVNDKGEIRFAIEPLVKRAGFLINTIIVMEK